jgi:low affinity Fe/Cu permease
MSFETWMSIINTGFMIIMAVFIAPLRRSLGKIDDLESKIDQLNVDNLRGEMRQVKARVIDLEKGHQGCLAELPKSYVSKHDLQASEVRRDHEFDKMNNKLDELLQRTAHLVGYGKS